MIFIGGICWILIWMFCQFCLFIICIIKFIIIDMVIYLRDIKFVELVFGQKRGKRMLGFESKFVRILIFFGVSKELIDYVLDSVCVVFGVVQFFFGLQFWDVEGGFCGLW